MTGKQNGSGVTQGCLSEYTPTTTTTMASTSFFNTSSYSHAVNRQLEAYGAATFGSLERREQRLSRFVERALRGENAQRNLNAVREKARDEVEERAQRRADELWAEGQALNQAEEVQSGMETAEYYEWKVDEAWDAYTEMVESYPDDLSAITASLEDVQSALENLMRCYAPPMARTNALLNEYGNDSDSEDSDYTE